MEDAELNQGQGAPYGVNAVLPMASVNTARLELNDVNLGVILPYCDAGVQPLPGVRFFDDVRYNLPGDTAPKHTILSLGANHNFFNTVWTYVSGDDWLGGFG